MSSAEFTEWIAFYSIDSQEKTDAAKEPAESERGSRFK